MIGPDGKERARLTGQEKLNADFKYRAALLFFDKKGNRVGVISVLEITFVP